LLIAGCVVAAGSSAAALSRPPATGPAYVSILFGRAQWAPSQRCHPAVAPPDGKTLADVKQLFATRGWIGTANAVVNYADQGACATGSAIYASWSQLLSLHASPKPWETISASQSYVDFSNLSASQVEAQSCGALPAYTANGFTRAWGLFAYPGGGISYDKRGPGSGNAQTDIVHNCFAFGRIYGSGSNTKAGATTSPWLIRALSPVGGGAADAGGTYVVPSRVAAHLAAGIQADHWFVLQFYRFRSGALSGDHNCLGPENTHFTEDNEEYCWEDFQTILNAIPQSAVVTDPATVACAWGRFPDAGTRPTCS
jgi:hypothetical protein